MKKIALTGVIGSGKTTAATFFKDLGIPVFIADDCAKDLMISDPDLKSQIINLLGEHAYICLLYTSPSPRDGLLSRMPSSA